jgi:membrane protease YdiL (CAAX protease family)
MPAMVSQKAWSLDTFAQLMFLIILTLMSGIVLLAPIQIVKLGLSDNARDLIGMILMTLCFHGSILLWTRRFLRVNQVSWRQAFFAASRSGRSAAIGLFVGAVLVAPLLWLQAALTEFAERVLGLHLQAQEIVEKLGSPAMSLTAKVFVGFTAVALAPLAEEILFRGLLYPTVKQMGHPRVALWGTALLFGLSHFNRMAFVPLTLFAAILVFLYEMTDNLLAPIMAHCALNAVNYILILRTAPSGGASH